LNAIAGIATAAAKAPPRIAVDTARSRELVLFIF